MEPDQQIRNLRDFLLVYNRMTEICFQRCSSNFNYRSLTMDEERCADNCAGKLIRANHRLMGTYVQLMPKMVQRRMEEMESKVAESVAAAEPVTADLSPAASAPAAQTPSAGPHTALPPTVPDAQAAALRTPAALVSPAAAFAEAPETASALAGSKTDPWPFLHGPAFPAASPLESPADARDVMPPPPEPQTFLPPENVPVTTMASPSTESRTGQDGTP